MFGRAKKAKESSKKRLKKFDKAMTGIVLGGVAMGAFGYKVRRKAKKKQEEPVIEPSLIARIFGARSGTKRSKK